MTDAELIALAALVQAEYVGIQGENDLRRLNGQSPAYRDAMTDNGIILEAELKRRNCLKMPGAV